MIGSQWVIAASELSLDTPEKSTYFKRYSSHPGDLWCKILWAESN
jgi:hypothetical protein